VTDHAVDTLAVGDNVQLEILRVAHGGHCVARLDGRVIFVRHTAPGEVVRAVITEIRKGGKFVAADAVEIITASPARINPACDAAGVCGGCDWQHLKLPYQRELKTAVLREQLVRMAGIAEDDPLLETVEVKQLPDDFDGLGWRTRVEYATDRDGRTGFRKHSSNDVVAVGSCPVAVPAIASDGICNVPWQADSEIRAIATSTGEVEIIPAAVRTNPVLHETVGTYQYRVHARGFWQGHRSAPAAFISDVLRLGGIKTGDHVIDLYAGAGLFSLPIAAAVGPGGRVDCVEGDPQAVKDLETNVRNHPTVSVDRASVDGWLAKTRIKRCDVVVLDPPRTGANREVVERIAKLDPRTVVYVACDPAALSRDLAIFADHGFHPVEISAWDAFPMTHHFETVVKLAK